MSLMLHSSFGTERMRLLAREILAQGLRATTYREITEGLRQGKCPASNSIIVSIDDFGTDWLRPHFQSMIRAFTDRGLSLVVAVNVHGPQDPDAWVYLRHLEELGNEIANHTIDHYNLARLKNDEVRWQVKGAHQIICVNLGNCPETLILPFGINDGNGAVRSAAAGYSYIVGIPGGRSFEGKAPYYLGRIGPDNFDQQATLRDLAATFWIPPSAGAEFLQFRASIGRGCAAGPSPSIALPLAFCIPAETQAVHSAGGQDLSAAASSGLD
jgi:peptidoglycan/xylan/chitin deacetylase (PgdA/CDA1 family)